MAEISFREIRNYIVIQKTKMITLKYKQNENIKGSCIVSGCQHYIYCGQIYIIFIKINQGKQNIFSTIELF